MARRQIQLFNLSFLDVLSAALGAVIFLFIITPKGGESPSIFHPVVVSIDTLHRQIFGSLEDEFYPKQAGDTLLVLIKGYDELPTLADCPECPPPRECPELPKREEKIAFNQAPKTRKKEVVSVEDEPIKSIPAKIPSQAKKSDAQKKVVAFPKEAEGKYKGDPPSVPCNVSFEISWDNLKDNVDLYVCKGRSCVYGKKRNINKVGQWDSGKSKIKVFGSDLRTTQEAVRQFGRIIPGTYELYAHFKESEQNRRSVNIKGLVYTKNDKGVAKGESFYKSLTLNKKKRTLIGTVILKEDGQFKFTKK